MSRILNGRGLVHIYTGSGKGKTTAALGLALRVLGWGGSVCMVQFIKGYPQIGEMVFAAGSGGRFVLEQFAVDGSMSIDEQMALKRREQVRAAFERATRAVRGGDFDLVILDEINNALHLGLLEVDEVLGVLNDRPAGVEIVLTGRGAPTQIIAVADYVTEMISTKHPFESGTRARRGIDY